ncbi:NAD-glutamate dehydrogenase [Spirilliplanes yamanashiensis]|uniref:NAD-glutamate dehydrogenase n=1 Tax=Spirilliplanes yamanashiensis TaxID=42233 RepID=A0A8J3Y4G6_9ACTN|nr:NAD-glutamate dehydrogenase [Spirilliplanes yamanashiensis]MDP9819857.1 glutamate dehydrogenase [Spirilliplanes yamanashiensis]GIJ01324.1 NAD-glutamate dehydrogenase [Spirilliplanes yamanashiensis]
MSAGTDRHGEIDAETDQDRPEGSGAALAGRLGADPDAGELEEPLPDAAQLIAEAVELAGADHGTAGLVSRFWRFAPDEELVDHTPEQLHAAATAHRELARQRVPGQLRLEVTAPGKGNGGHSTVRIVTDDMPFLVDSTVSLLTAHQLEVHLLVHPLIVVRREPLGALADVAADVEPDDAIDGDIVESWILAEIDPVADPDARARLARELQRVLTDVRAAVEDWPKMRRRALAVADELGAARGTADAPPVPDKDVTDTIELMRWLTADNFTFLGYREYHLTTGEGGEQVLVADAGTGLGILRGEHSTPRVLSSMAPEAFAQSLEKRLLILTKANSRATVHRSAYLDYIGVKVFDERGEVVGERRFLGLFSSSAYRTSVRDLPVVRRKVAEVLDRSGLSPRSHSGRDLLQILETYPRDELFQIKTDELYDAVVGVLRMAGRRQLRVFLRRDAYGRFISCLIYLPRDRFTTTNRLRMQEILLRELNGVGVDHTTRVTEGMLARVHFVVRTDPQAPPRTVDPDALAEQLADATRLWDDDFGLVLERKLGEQQAKGLFSRYVDALPDSYKDGHSPYEAAQDLAKLELLEEPGQIEMHLFRKRAPHGVTEGEPDDGNVRFKVYRQGEPMMLSAVLPVLHSLGVQVVDERPYEIRRADTAVWLYDFGLNPPAEHRELAEVRPHVENAFAASWRGEAEVDGFNELVLLAGLTWRQVVVLRAYAKYLRQAGTIYSQRYVENTFIAHPDVARLLVDLFETRFSPRLELSADVRAKRAAALAEQVTERLDAVDSLDQDRILRSFLRLITATLRTSFFQRDRNGRPKSYIAFKLDPQAVPDLPAPRPKFEIFVYSPRFEGVHLRYGAVARGGLRWSDRREDFRTEILGLVKAQMVKNAVIVPVGAKGGFVLKQRPGDRDEAVACYQLFISALLDVTDNISGGKIVPPHDVVRHDGDDPYLVVAADKGTATFSDIANEISVGKEFWLGDAFASGGSAGYDHKKMGITARGAWESVKRHFRELGFDTQSEDFTVVGVGDMSGDVFGNGMLLSEHIRLVAAFDHRHIFLDPDPDAATSFAERRRLFELPRSSWADYDAALISEGGGVYPRTLKKIAVTPQVAAALGIEAAELSPAELMRAILTAPVDLLFNGGIGTYVKAATETHAEVGDKANDAIRVDGRELRVKVVGEGGNLGLTQRGRIEYALASGRIYTDFIDNSAGVDCSDHEVNIKILLGGAVADGELTVPERDRLLESMTDEVAALSLRDNYDQARALGNAREQALSLLPVHRRMITDLERAGLLDRALEALPTDEELAVRGEAGTGLTPPEFAVLLAYVKITMDREVLASSLADEPWATGVLARYFPTPLRERFAGRMAGHRLRREIVSTSLVNEVVNRGGTSFVYRAVEETGASAADVIRAYVVVRDVFGIGELWDAVEAQDNRMPVAAQTLVYLSTRRLLDRAVRWLVSNRRSPLDVAGEIERLRPGVARLLGALPSLFRGAERESLAALTANMCQRGVPDDIADRAMRIVYSFGVLDILQTATEADQDINAVADVYYVLSERFRVDDLLSRISSLPRNDRWQTLARMALRYDLYAALAGLTAEVLASTPASASAADRVDEWEQVNAASIARTRNAIGEFEDSRSDLAALSVVLRQIRTLVRTSAAA